VTRAQESSERVGAQFLQLTFPARDGRPIQIRRTASVVPPLAQGDQVEVIFLPRTPEYAILVAERSWVPLLILGTVSVIGFVWLAVAMVKAKDGRL
jgi:hypothetical protein